MREFSVPERLGVAGAAAALAAFVTPRLRAATGLGVPCPLRTVTGVPCPACGLTTAAEALAAGDPAGAAAANPVVFGLVALTAAGLSALVRRAVGGCAPVPWSAAARRRVGWVAGVVAGGSWLFQLYRFGVM